MPKPADAERFTTTGLELFHPLPFAVGVIEETVTVGSELSLITVTLGLFALRAVQPPTSAVTV